MMDAVIHGLTDDLPSKGTPAATEGQNEGQIKAPLLTCKILSLTTAL